MRKVRRTMPNNARAGVLVLVALSTVAACASTTSETARPLRVLTYNIHAGKDASQEHNLERVARVIHDAAADVVLLQESCGSADPGYSFPAHEPDRRIDYLLLRQTGCTTARVLDARASDHRPVLATLQLRPSHN